MMARRLDARVQRLALGARDGARERHVEVVEDEKEIVEERGLASRDAASMSDWRRRRRFW